MAVQDVSSQISAQSSTQSTQEASLPQASQYANDIWGSLIPLNPQNKDMSRIDLLKSKSKYTIGRSHQNDIALPSAPKFISQVHCTIEWDGEETLDSAIKVEDLNSQNGTFINGTKIGRGNNHLLRDWNVISFGRHISSSFRSPSQDYRFFFRLMASSQRPDEGVYAMYDVKSVIGRGAFATVVKALHRVDGNYYAIKMFPGGRLRDILNKTSRGVGLETTRRHLMREFGILQRLHHTNVCQLKEAFFEDYSVSIVLELAEGGDLMQYVLQREVLMEPEAQGFTYQICDALAYVHKRGVVHRDLKPENVLLTKDRPPIVKVADFGLANVIDSLSRLQTRCGTPAYVAPEVRDSRGRGYDQVVDSWSLGVMVYMMLTQQNPFHHEAEAEVDWALLHEFNISEDGENFIRSLLEYDPQRRMTPAQGMRHPWLAVQAERHQAELAAARTQSSAVSSTVRPTPTPTPPPDRVGPSKRKAAEVARSLSALSIEDKQRPPPKRRRGQEGMFAVPHVPSSHVPPPHVSPHSHSPIPWPAYDSDSSEVPGLGQWRYHP